ncbi:SusE domain-containing protein [Dinghuibacter silviterrae]|uniref:SusE-like outer membrane protein n=1 Tax=Dinghuibacter silviterrae TaxID=1539049 RepID=A0A4R8DRB7_9BACT|nr:SusE domain-containing protein [Dinghuibacter silviterrae]TDW99964.1 SusE-like outer membrane protein [Dinghuibacter silviterrae]
MRKHFLLYSGVAVAVWLAACSKMTNPYYKNGSTPTLASSTTTIAVPPSDSLTSVLVLSWSNPHYATDSSTEKYTIQIDSSGRNFTQAVSFVISGALTDTFIAKQINNVVLGFGASFGVPYKVDVRVMSSYANNNELLTSNTVTLTVTPYKIPPKVQPPASGKLFLVGSATAGAWNNPVPLPSQQFEMVDSTDYAGVFNLTGGGQFLALPVNGDWTNKFATSDNSEDGTGGTFGYNGSNSTYNTNFTGPTTSGWYIIWFNFQAGTLSITPFSGVVPDSLFIVGSATAGAWNNPVPDPAQKLTRVNSSQFSIKLPLSGGNQYLLLPVNGSWTNKYAVRGTNDTVSGGTFGYNGNNGTFNTNFTGPTTTGTYTMTVDFLSWTYTVQ